MLLIYRLICSKAIRGWVMGMDGSGSSNKVTPGTDSIAGSVVPLAMFYILLLLLFIFSSRQNLTNRSKQLQPMTVHFAGASAAAASFLLRDCATSAYATSPPTIVVPIPPSFLAWPSSVSQILRLQQEVVLKGCLCVYCPVWSACQERQQDYNFVQFLICEG